LDFNRNPYKSGTTGVYTSKPEDQIPQAMFSSSVEISENTSRIEVISIEFLQEKNGVLYLLTNGTSLGII
jgi:hypothetical protein